MRGIWKHPNWTEGVPKPGIRGAGSMGRSWTWSTIVGSGETGWQVGDFRAQSPLTRSEGFRLHLQGNVELFQVFQAEKQESKTLGRFVFWHMLSGCQHREGAPGGGLNQGGAGGGDGGERLHSESILKKWQISVIDGNIFLNYLVPAVAHQWCYRFRKALYKPISRVSGCHGTGIVQGA